MNITSVVTRVQRQFGDESGVQVTEADVLRWINDAQNEAVTQIKLLLPKTADIATVANQQIYNFPADYLDTDTIKFKVSGTNSFYNLRGQPAKALNEYIDSWEGTDVLGDPIYFCHGSTEDTFRVFPVPSDATGIFRVSYGRIPTDVVTTASVIDLPDYLHPYVVEFCLMKAYEMDEEWEASDRKAQYVQSTLDANATRRREVSQETYPIIVPTAGDYL